MCDVLGTTWLSPLLTVHFKVIEGREPGVNRWLYVFKFGDFVGEVADVLDLHFVGVVEVIHHYIGWRTYLDVFLLVTEIVEQI